jgi:hypothetical protein
MRVLKYRDVTRLTFYGRYDKNINDATSIYAGFDRALTTTTGGGINSLSLTNAGTIGFTASPNVYITNATNLSLANTTLSTNIPATPISSVQIISGGTGFTSNPTLLFYGGNPTTIATATATQAAGIITTLTLTNIGAGYTSIPLIGWSGGGSMNITANITTGLLSSYTITTSPYFTTAPTILISGGGGATQITTCTINAGTGFINAIALPASTGYATAPTIYIIGGTGLGAVLFNPIMYNTINSIVLSNNLPLGTFTSQPVVSFNNGGVINITATLTGAVITAFTITNGGYTNCFSSQPTIVISGGGGYATTTCTLTNGVITAITLPITGGINSFTSIPTVSVYGGGLPTTLSVLNPYNIITGAYSPYQNTKRLRFDLNQELQALRLSDNAELYLEYVRMPALSVNSTCFKNLRLIGASNINTFDSIQGSTGNPILFSCESGNVATNYIIASTDYSRLNIPPNFLNKGYIEFEMETILSANTVIFTAAQLNELIIRLVIEEPNNEKTQDNNLGPEYTKGRIINFNNRK